MSNTLSIFVGGFADATHQVMRSYVFGYFVEQYPDVPVLYQPHSANLGGVLRGLPDGTRINLVGHSWGGNIAARSAIHSGRNVNLLITIDPVSWRIPAYRRVRDHVAQWVNVNAVGGERFDRGNVIAGIGRRWGKGPARYSDYREANAAHGWFRVMMQDHGSDHRHRSAEEVLVGNSH